MSLTPQDQALFVEFRRRQDNWQKILESGALDIKNGSFTCHLDGAGNIRRIDREDKLYIS